MLLEHILAHVPLARKYTDRIFESKDGTTSMKIVNYIERHNFCCNDLLTKSNHTEIETFEVERNELLGHPVEAYLIIRRWQIAQNRSLFKLHSCSNGGV